MSEHSLTSLPAVQPALPGGVQRVVLTGFMGSGKSTIGRLSGEQLRWAFHDLDEEVEARAGLTVPQIFSEHGEPAFRELESTALASLLQTRNAVIALGGGAVEEPRNRLLLERVPATAVVLLEASFATLCARCTAQATLPGSIARPVFADLDAAEARFHLRQQGYREVATHTFETETISPKDTAAAVLALLSL